MLDFNVDKNIFRSEKFRSVVFDAIEFMNGTPAYELPPPSSFVGGGCYALYYEGKLKIYQKLREREKRLYTFPIYTGKAVPSGWRTSRVTVSNAAPLYSRLREHSRSIDQAENLKLQDFRCKFIILNDVESDLITLVEAELIRKYKPLWNMVVDGFGNHDPGSGRYEQAKSEWDVLHPGRRWASKCVGQAPNLENVIRKVRTHLETALLS
jgi:hypothetical protein